MKTKHDTQRPKIPKYQIRISMSQSVLEEMTSVSRSTGFTVTCICASAAEVGWATLKPRVEKLFNLRGDK